jgi:hypothetical protein
VAEEAQKKVKGQRALTRADSFGFSLLHFAFCALPFDFIVRLCRALIAFPLEDPQALMAIHCA